MSIVALEIGVAALLHRGDHLYPAELAGSKAGKWPSMRFVSFFSKRARRAEDGIRKLRQTQGRGRTVLVIGSSGYDTLRDQVGDLSTILEKCLGANIMLVNPFSQGASARIRR